jgi:hypothetical protein
VAKNGPFSLKFCQIVALMSPHRGAAAGEADLLLSFDSQATAIGIGGAVGAIGTACAVRIVDGVGRKTASRTGRRGYWSNQDHTGSRLACRGSFPAGRRAEGHPPGCRANV